MVRILSVMFRIRLYCVEWTHPMSGEKLRTEPMYYDKAHRYAYVWYGDRNGRIVRK